MLLEKLKLRNQAISDIAKKKKKGYVLVMQGLILSDTGLQDHLPP